MKIKAIRWLLPIPVVVLLVWFLADQDMRRFVLNPPMNKDVLFWSIDQRDATFRMIDRLPLLAKSRIIKAGVNPQSIPQGPALELDIDLDDYLYHQRNAGLVVLHNGKVRIEEYRLNFSREGRWTSFSVAKSFTSTLLGAALKDGYISSLDDKVSEYLPGLRGSAYDDVSIEQLMTMTSGVKWNEDYSDPLSDVAKFNSHKPKPGLNATVSYMRTLPREAPAGTKWVYKTGETNLIGVLINKATHKKLADYLEEKIWQPFGMEGDASWIISSTGEEISGCCIQAEIRDFAKFGLFMLAEGKIDGRSVLPDNWVREATKARVKTTSSTYGYGYQWWVLDDGAYTARGIFGQGIFIDPKRQLVIASNGNWPEASNKMPGSRSEKRLAFYRTVQRAIDAEASRSTLVD